MFDTYKDIFNARGAAYHQAMLEDPHAREQEFGAALSRVRLKPGETLCDMPSGGGYLWQFLREPDVKLLCVETSATFADKCPRSTNVRSVLGELNAVPLEAGSTDAIISLAGLHHVGDRPAVFAEMRRLLRTGGRVCVGDVAADSPQARFLDEFVDQHNSMGHHGEFLKTGEVRAELRDAGFAVEDVGHDRYHWTFASETAMARFCRLLFGLDQADEEMTLAGIREYVGCDQVDGRWRMNWALTFAEGVAA